MSHVDFSILWHVGSYELSHGFRFLLPSQNTDLLNEQKVLAWGVAIEGGARPTPITATVKGANCEFILDGHHSCEALVLLEHQFAGWRLHIWHLLGSVQPIGLADGCPSLHRLGFVRQTANRPEAVA